MLPAAWNGVVGFFTQGHERTQRAKRNIAATLIIRGLNIAVGLALVPLTINFLDPARYGIWVTLSSVISWFVFFDIGLGNGLRNRFAEALALGKHDLARVYVSTTYAILALIIGGLLIIFYLINPFLNWNQILNAGDIILKNELGLLALIVFTFFCINFIFNLITTILTADQRPAKASFINLLGKIFALILITILTKTTDGSLIYLAIALSSPPVLVLLLSSVWFYSRRYKIYRPSLRSIDFSKARGILDLGVNFFIIQFAAILLYQTNNIIISHLFGPEEVTPYNIAFKYFSIIMMGFSIIMTPFWSAFTEAWAKIEVEWIKRIMNKLRLAWIILFAAGLLMLTFSPWVYRIWIGAQIEVPFIMSLLVMLWVLLNAWNGIFSHFLNGVGKIKLQLVIGISVALLNIPLAIILGNLIGIEGVLLANVLLAILQAFIFPLQYSKIISSRASGIWIK